MRGFISPPALDGSHCVVFEPDGDDPYWRISYDEAKILGLVDKIIIQDGPITVGGKTFRVDWSKHYRQDNSVHAWLCEVTQQDVVAVSEHLREDGYL